MKQPTPRDHDLIRDMLRRFRDAQDTLLQSVGGGSGNPLQMPATWTREMRELERCLAALASSKPRTHRHLMARYVDPVLSRRTMTGRIHHRGDGDIMVWPQLGPSAEVRTFAKLPDMARSNQYTCLVASWPSWVLKTVCEDGVARLCRDYRIEPYMPVEMLKAA